MNTKNNFIQLPPLPRSMNADEIRTLWEYAKMPPESQERLQEYLDMTAKMSAVPVESMDILNIPAERIEGFRETIKDMIGNIIVEISQFSCWLYHQIYVRGEAVDDLLTKYPESGDFIRIMSEVYAELMEEERSDKGQD